MSTIEVVKTGVILVTGTQVCKKVHEHKNRPTDKTCRTCGEALEELHEHSERVCGVCRTVVLLADKFCGKCGQDLPDKVETQEYRFIGALLDKAGYDDCRKALDGKKYKIKRDGLKIILAFDAPQAPPSRAGGPLGDQAIPSDTPSPEITKTGEKTHGENAGA